MKSVNLPRVIDPAKSEQLLYQLFAANGGNPSFLFELSFGTKVVVCPDGTPLRRSAADQNARGSCSMDSTSPMWKHIGSSSQAPGPFLIPHEGATSPLRYCGVPSRLSLALSSAQRNPVLWARSAISRSPYLTTCCPCRRRQEQEIKLHPSLVLMRSGELARGQVMSTSRQQSC